MWVEICRRFFRDFQRFSVIFRDFQWFSEICFFKTSIFMLYISVVRFWWNFLDIPWETTNRRTQNDRYILNSIYYITMGCPWKISSKFTEKEMWFFKTNGYSSQIDKCNNGEHSRNLSSQFQSLKIWPECVGCHLVHRSLALFSWNFWTFLEIHFIFRLIFHAIFHSSKSSLVKLQISNEFLKKIQNKSADVGASLRVECLHSSLKFMKIVLKLVKKE